MNIGTPPSRGGGGQPRTVGKHQVPLVNVLGEDGKRDSRTESDNGMQQQGPSNGKWLIGRTPGIGMSHSRSFPNAGSLLSSPADSPVSLRRTLPPSGIKLPLPPASLLNGLPNQQNVQKSASSASLAIQHSSSAVSPSAAKSDRLREAVNVPNAGQLLMAAKADMLRSPRALGARLPPLQLPKGSPAAESGKQRREKDEANGPLKQMTQSEGNGGRGRIATPACGPQPHLQPMEPQKAPSGLSSPLPPPASAAVMADEDQQQLSSRPPTAAMELPSRPPPRVPSLQSVPNEVPMDRVPAPRRRPSSAGQIGREIPLALTAHKPLPAISEPIGAKRGINSLSAKKRPQNSRKPWRLAVKCLLIFLFLSIPVVIFVFMMLFTDGFSGGGSAAETASLPPPSDGGPWTEQTLTTTSVPSSSSTAVNIVGGAIFAPISMQNETDKA